MKLLSVLLAVVGAALIVYGVMPVLSKAEIGEVKIYERVGTEQTTCDPPGQGLNIAPPGGYDSGWWFPDMPGDPTRVEFRVIAKLPVTATVYWGIARDGTISVADGNKAITFQGGASTSLSIPVNDHNPMVSTKQYRLGIEAHPPPGYPVCMSYTPSFTVYGREGTGGGGCPAGTHWDIALGYCVADDTSHDCDDGYHWNETLGACEENVVPPYNGGNCTAGQHWDESAKACVENESGKAGECRWLFILLGAVLIFVAWKVVP